MNSSSSSPCCISTAPNSALPAPHLYPFGGFDKMFDWLTPKLAG